MALLALTLPVSWPGACAAAADLPPAPTQALTQVHITGAFSFERLPDASGQSTVGLWHRAALVVPQRYRVVVLPGSGCTGWGPFAAGYTAGLLHAEILLLQKPEAEPHGGPAPSDCSARFIARDALSAWESDAVAALREWNAHADLATETPVPTMVVGVSEGVEVMAQVAASLPNVVALVAMSHPGLDPWPLARRQAELRGQRTAWQALEHALADGGRSDGEILEGRTLRYWRELRTWQVEQPLRDAPWPLLQASGEDDVLIPPQAYAHFRDAMAGRAAPVCVMRLTGADHGLQGPRGNGLKKVWALLEDWGRASRVACGGPGLQD